MKLNKLTKAKKTKTARRPSKAAYVSPLRKEQARMTESRIQEALFELFRENGSPEGITYKAVAQKAGVTEMTVYRYFPERQQLLKSLWSQINQMMGPNITMPDSVESLMEQNKKLHFGFEQYPEIAALSISSSQGREMRASLNSIRRQSFLGIVDELNPKLAPEKKIQFASILQLLHSAYAWDSLKQQWELTGSEIAEATQNALSILIQHIKQERNI